MIVGVELPGYEGSRPRIERQVRELGLERHVMIVGERPARRDPVLARRRRRVLPRHALRGLGRMCCSSPWPAAGPVVSTRVGGMPRSSPTRPRHPGPARGRRGSRRRPPRSAERALGRARHGRPRARAFLGPRGARRGRDVPERDRAGRRRDARRARTWPGIAPRGGARPMHARLVNRVIFPLHERLKGKPTHAARASSSAPSGWPVTRSARSSSSGSGDTSTSPTARCRTTRALLDEHGLRPERDAVPRRTSRACPS